MRLEQFDSIIACLSFSKTDESSINVRLLLQVGFCLQLDVCLMCMKGSCSPLEICIGFIELCTS